MTPLLNKSSLEGLLLVDKAPLVSSFYLVKLLRKITGVKKIGHAGTLDPLAEGLMLLLVGRKYTQKASSFINFDKDYEATLFLGKSTDTYDREGEVVATSSKVPSLEEIKEVLETNFQGELQQKPPMYSAKKIGGKKLYELARKNITLSLKPFLVTVKTQLLQYDYPYIKLFIRCSKGTYIRSIAQDLGEKLGCKAHLFHLIRHRIGPYLLQNSISQKSLSEKPHPLPFLHV